MIYSVEGFEFLKTTGHLKRCYGFLIDGDFALRWKDQCEAARHHSVSALNMTVG